MAGITVTEERNSISVDSENPSLVYVTLGGVVNNQATLLQVWGYPDQLAVKVGTGRFYVPVRITLLGVSATVDTSPTGADVVIDLNVDGTSVFSGTLPTVTAGSNIATEVTDLSTYQVEAGQVLTVDVDQVGSIEPGRDLTVTVRYRVN